MTEPLKNGKVYFGQSLRNAPLQGSHWWQEREAAGLLALAVRKPRVLALSPHSLYSAQDPVDRMGYLPC